MSSSLSGPAMSASSASSMVEVILEGGGGGGGGGVHSERLLEGRV